MHSLKLWGFENQKGQMICLAIQAEGMIWTQAVGIKYCSHNHYSMVLPKMVSCA